MIRADRINRNDRGGLKKSSRPKTNIGDRE